MTKHYFSKSAIFLAMLASATVVQVAKADQTSSSIANSESITSSAPILSENQPITTNSSSAQNSNLKLADLPVTSAEPATSNLSVSANDNNQLSPLAKQAANLPLDGQTVDVRIVSTTDIHSNLVNYDYYQDKDSQSIGLAKAAILIDQAKAENPNTVLVDNGDILQGTPLATYTAIINPIKPGETHPMYAALNALGYDASTLGNHEFNYGLPYLERAIASAGLPIVNANVMDSKTGKNLFKAYDIITKTFKDKNGQPTSLKIGITGIVPPQILNWDKANLEGKVTVKDSVEAITDLVPTIKNAGADIILVLAHTGIGDNIYEKGEENVGYQIASIAGVDAVVTGHSHAEFPSGIGNGPYESYGGVNGISGLINGTPVTMAGKYGDHIGIIDLNLTYNDGKWAVNKNLNHAEIRKIDSKSNLAKSEILALAKKVHQETIAYVRQQVGQTTAPITSYFALVKDDPSVQIVNNAQLWYAKQELAGSPEASLPLLSAAAPFKAGTRNDPSAYTDIPAGPLAIKNVADLYLYDNVATLLKVTGADLKEWLEMSAGQFNTIDPSKKEVQNIINTDYRTYNFDVIDGISYEFDITQPNKYDAKGSLINPNASRVRNLTYLGKAIDPKQEFMVVTNNYRASGTFPGAKNASMNHLLNLENRQALINYITSEKTINPSADNNWYFVDTIKGLNLHFLSATKAKDLSNDYKDINYSGPSQIEGFADFSFTYVKPELATDRGATSSQQALAVKDRQAIYQLAAAAYQETKDKAILLNSNQKQTQLPQTGSKESSGALILGLGFLSLATFFKKRKVINK
ncbi:bifunctional 2',3'-cyclic-nucleotide 2'-phosphodiesterase/3'-nucleotidase [Streptococcus didelphis]|uniref:bifunctional 2',3'-cyclic-nucleotide 2'-phosphodiesterase/3'-nucleotidase n=1 Tax=Streptococcus didelphis TaxID=102886 RepID=UPI000367DE5F|nr:bifunctional 2',3'-cyclic-nucleotide 2'-phosphodiesterase/3'-nucleotidase [Streptococcus didelphis]